MRQITSAQISINNRQRPLFFILFAFLLFLFPTPNIYFQSSAVTNGIFTPQRIDLPEPPFYPLDVNKVEAPTISAAGVYIVDLPSNVVLFEKNANVRFLPASTTKIVTAIVALDYYHLDDVLTVKSVMNSGKTMGLVPNEKITAESLLYGTLIHSANDAAYSLAENYPAGIAGFVEEMNKKAVQLNLTDTHFTNPAGFDDSQNYTTPVDLARLAKVALNNKIFAKIVATRSITVSDTNYTYFHELRNVNELLGKVAGVAGVKTGFTQSAGEILVSEVKKNGQSVLFVVLKSQDRFKDTEKLIDWVFNNFTWQDITKISPTVREK